MTASGRPPPVVGPWRCSRSSGSTSSAAGRDLRVTDRTIERHAVDKLTAAVVGLGTPVLFAAVAAAAGVAVPYGLVAVAALGFGVAGFLLPDVLLRDAARARRDGMRHALSAYLDLVNVLLAGSAGTETALAAAADAGDGWAFAELRACLAQARARRQSPWEAFSSLGAELGVGELQELAASVRLAGEQGAKIKASLGAKAAIAARPAAGAGRSRRPCRQRTHGRTQRRDVRRVPRLRRLPGTRLHRRRHLRCRLSDPPAPMHTLNARREH